MAEFCYDCYKKVLKHSEDEHALVISRKPVLCEGCGHIKPTVIRIKTPGKIWLRGLFKGTKN